MTTRAKVIGEGDIRAAINGKAVVIIIYFGASNSNATGACNVEAVGIVAKGIIGSTFLRKRLKGETA